MNTNQNKYIFENISYVDRKNAIIVDSKFIKTLESQTDYREKPILFADKTDSDRIMREKLLTKYNSNKK